MRWYHAWVGVLVASLLACTQVVEVTHRHTGSDDLSVTAAAFDSHKELVRDGVLVRPNLKKLGHSVTPTAYFRFYAKAPAEVHVQTVTAVAGEERVELKVDKKVSLAPDEASSLQMASVTCEFRDAAAAKLLQKDGVRLDLAFDTTSPQQISFDLQSERSEKLIPAIGGW